MCAFLLLFKEINDNDNAAAAAADDDDDNDDVHRTMTFNKMHFILLSRSNNHQYFYV